MQLWKILATAAAGVGAGHVGAWIQRRRGTASTPTDAVDPAVGWENRRMALYEATSGRVSDLLRLAHDLGANTSPQEFVRLLHTCRTLARTLETELDGLGLLGTQALREASFDLAVRLLRLRRTLAALEQRARELAAGPDPQGGTVLAVLREREAATRSPEQARGASAAYEHDEVRAFNDALAEFYMASGRWFAAARGELDILD